MSLDGNAWVNYWLRDPFWGVVNYAIYYFLRMLPVAAASDIGRRLGLAAGRFRFPEVTAQCDQNLRLIRPDLTAPARREMVRQMWASVGRTEAEMTVLDCLWDAAELTVINEEHVQAPLRAGRPIVFVFPHLGNWEALAILGRRYGIRLNVVYEQLENRFERYLVAKIRRQIGYRQISPTRNGIREIYSALERHEAVGFAIDEFRSGNVIAPTFGRTLPRDSNIHYALKLARKFNAAILPCLCVRTSPLAFTVTISDEMIVPDATDLNALCETWIRAHPEQWYMLHRLRMEVPT